MNRYIIKIQNTVLYNNNIYYYAISKYETENIK